VPLSNALSSDEALATLPPKAAVAAKALAALFDVIAGSGQVSAKAAVEKAIGASGYRQMLEESGDSEDKDRIDNLSELSNAAAQFDEALRQAEGPEDGREANPDTSGLMGFLEQTALAADIDDWHDRADRITLMTMHAAKGLEFGAVLIVGLDEGILPHANSSGSKSQLEEERRVFFVAMTRAKERLYLFRADERMLHGTWRFNIPSRFLKEIPPELVQVETPGFVPPVPRRARPSDDEAEFVVPPVSGGGAAKSAVPGPGTRVRHREFGPGIVKSVTPQGPWHKMTVHFPPYGEKKLIFEKAGLEIIS
jgi:DNA helicase-2/ATP-dependent DNA helicase PcrA